MRSTRLLALFGLLPLAACNLAWEGDKGYAPPPASTVAVSGFGINDEVDVIGGALPITVTRNIANTGALPVAAGYDVTEAVELLVFSRTAGAAGWSSGPPATHLLYSCTQPGPALGPGDSAAVSFTFPGPDCTAGPTAPPAGALACGMYQETLTIDAGGDVAGDSAADNAATHFFFVPSALPRLNLSVTLDPTNDPNQAIVPVQQVQVAAFAYPAGVQTVVTHAATIDSAPAGGGWIYDGLSPVVGRLSGATAVLVPAPPITVAPPGAPTNATYQVTFNAQFVGPNETGSGPYYVETLDGNVTAIAFDGCQIRDQDLLLQLLFEEQ
ncbi:MAG: hypothetical protein AB7S71_19955 [Dongiaceae bacterium]